MGGVIGGVDPELPPQLVKSNKDKNAMKATTRFMVALESKKYEVEGIVRRSCRWGCDM